jgi:hypothetical protein
MWCYNFPWLKANTKGLSKNLGNPKPNQTLDIGIPILERVCKYIIEPPVHLEFSLDYGAFSQ